MKKPLDMFIEYLNSEDTDMFITGQAGTGKTTKLAELVSYCIEQRLSYVVCAYTHKACSVLNNKIPDADIKTLHSFLRKRPTIKR